MTTASETPAAIKARFLARLAAEGIFPPADQADAAAADFLVLDRHLRLIRTALAVDASLPLGFTPPPGVA